MILLHPPWHEIAQTASYTLVLNMYVKMACIISYPIGIELDGRSARWLVL